MSTNMNPTAWFAWTGPNAEVAAAVAGEAEKTLATVTAVQQIATECGLWEEPGEAIWRSAYDAWQTLPDEVQLATSSTPAMAAWGTQLRQSLASALQHGTAIGWQQAAHLGRFVIGASFDHRKPLAFCWSWPKSSPLTWPHAQAAWFVADEADASDLWRVAIGDREDLCIGDASGRPILQFTSPAASPQVGRRLPLATASCAGQTLVANWAEPSIASDFDSQFPQEQVATLAEPAAANDWQAALEQALSLIETADPLLADELMETISTVIPLAPLFNFHVSRVEANALGAIWCSLADPERLAEALVHEYGHTKLHLLQRSLDITAPDQADAPWFFSPWREDPRPLDGVLHGSFVAVWVTRFWRRLAQRTHQERHHLCWQRCAAKAVAATRELAAPDLFTHAGWRLVQSLQREALWHARQTGSTLAFEQEAAALLKRRQRWAQAHGRPEAPPNVRPLSIPTFVVKVASRCNLDCDYCYEYKFADQSWRQQPRYMSAQVARQLGVRLAEHARAHGLRRIDICLHGGEPLLLGRERLENVLQSIRQGVADQVALKFGIQTNGVLLDEDWARFFLRENVLVGVSLDGPPAVNDRQRVDHRGHGTHERTAAGIRLLAEHARRCFAGLLCVVDPSSDPCQVFEHLDSYSSPNIDFLLPHDNWALRHGDQGEDVQRHGWQVEPDRTPVGNWLAAAFDYYLSHAGAHTRVRLFDELIRVLLGGQATLESMGLAEARLLTVSPSGELQGVDTLKVTEADAVCLGLNVFADSVDAAATHRDVLARNIGSEGLCETCRGCPYLKSCGGGYLPHRWDSESGFDNPSVYCADLRRLIDHVRQAIVQVGEAAAC